MGIKFQQNIKYITREVRLLDFALLLCRNHCIIELTINNNECFSNLLQWNPAITKCHGTEKNVRYSGVFVIAKTPL